MNKIYKLHYENNKLKGFFINDIHGSYTPEPTININEELWQELLKKEYELKNYNKLPQKGIFVLEDIELFVEIEKKLIPHVPTQLETDMSFLSNIMLKIIEPMMLPEEEISEKKEVLVRLKEIIDRYK